MEPSDPVEYVEDISLTMTMDKTVYRPEEAVLATVQLSNNTATTQTLRKLDAGSVTFLFGKKIDEERMERQAVASRDEKLDELFELGAGESATRVFLLTRFTHYGGPLTAQAHYKSLEPLGRDQSPKIFSNVVDFEVKGEPLFERDADGLIMKQDAIRIATEASGKPVAAADAMLIVDEKGFFKWHVNLDVKDGASSAKIAYFVDPYRGQVWRRAKPFNEELNKDPRLVKPANLPPLKGRPQAPRGK